MFLREFIYFDQDQAEMFDKGRYDPKNDSSVMFATDRRTGSRLTLKMLNSLRKAGDAREREQQEELDLIKKMYATPAEEAPGGLAGM